ncbi:uncharacterized protein LOC135930195 [Gordionus sp. m RMFG-2023]|uniref:uncharacterized protein LOC135930195 n=1 Tax=Gordionus sp. m RMFG-2023 TaxID=3053472 RepID=UPI0031FD72D6
MNLNSSVKTMLNGSGTTNNKWSGVAFLIKNKLKKYIIKFVPITERIAVLYLNTAYKPTILLNVYVPPKLTERMLFLEHLDNVISSLPKRYNIIAMGDFNTKIGHDITYKVSNTIGHTTVYNSNDKDGKKLLQICFDNNLKIENTFFKHKPPHLMTFSRGGHSSQIDFFLSNIHSWFADVKAILNINISDHKLIKAHIIIRSDEWRNNNTRRIHSTIRTTPEQPTKWHFTNINKTTYNETICSGLARIIQLFPTKPLEECWSDFKSAIFHAYNNLNHSQIPKREWLSANTKNLILSIKNDRSRNLELWKRI